MIGSTQVYNMLSSIRKKMLAAAQAQRAADRAAAEAHTFDPDDADQGGSDAAQGRGD